MKKNNKVLSVIFGLVCAAFAVALFAVYANHREIIAMIANVRLAFVAAYILPWLPLVCGIAFVLLAIQVLVANLTRYNPLELIKVLTEELWNPTR